MEISERGLQRKQLNNDFQRMLKAASPELLAIPEDAELRARLLTITGEMCAKYMSYPLLCGRFSELDDPTSDPEDQDMSKIRPVDKVELPTTVDVEIAPFSKDVHLDPDLISNLEAVNISGEGDSADVDSNGINVAEAVNTSKDVARKKKTQRKQKHNPIRQQLRMGMTIKEIQKGGAMNVPETVGRQGFARAIAVCFNRQTGSVTCGLSGKLRKVRVHPLIWGKSVEPGRPRGTCAEFKVVNTALLAGEQISDLVINVVDIATNQPKPRCRNCIMVTKTACVLSDDL